MRQDFDEPFERSFHRDLDRDMSRLRFRRAWASFVRWSIIAGTLFIPLLFVKKIQLMVISWVFWVFLVLIVIVSDEVTTEAFGDFESEIGVVTENAVTTAGGTISYQFEFEGATHTGIDHIEERLEIRDGEARFKAQRRFAAIQPGEIILLVIHREHPEEAMVTYPISARFITGFFIFAAVIALVVVTERLRGRTVLLGERRFVECLLLRPETSPRQICEQVQQGLRGGTLSRAMSIGWNVKCESGISPIEWFPLRGTWLKVADTRVPLVNWCPRALKKWFEGQPKPIDFEEFLKRLHFAHGHLNGPIDKPQLDDLEPPMVEMLNDDLATLARGPFDSEIRLSFAHLDRRVCLAGYESRPSGTLSPIKGAVERGGRHFKFIAGYRGCEQVDPNKYSVEVIGAPKDTVKYEIDAWAMIQMINGLLHQFHCRFWEWESVTKQATFLGDGLVEVTLELTFDPAGELQIRCVD